MAVLIKPLEWRLGRTHRGVVYHEIADTPFGQYSVWYSDGALWVPNKADHSFHGSAEAAKIAAQEHLYASMSQMVWGTINKEQK